MIFIHNEIIPPEAVTMLQNTGNCFSFMTHNVTDEGIAGHPDVFCCKVGNQLVAAPQIIRLLKNNFANIVPGASPVGFGFDATHYNAVVTDRYIIHNQKYTDPEIISMQNGRTFINVKQGFTRCSVLPLPDGSFITSDKGISKVLDDSHIRHLLVSSEDIILPGYRNGCIGGCFGIIDNLVFVIGQLKFHRDGYAIKNFIETAGCKLTELYDGPLFDGGSIIIL